jgi:hypothetical protein
VESPLPGIIENDPKERWIALADMTSSSVSPIAPIAIQRLANFGLTTSLNESMWIPADSNTTKLLKQTDGWMNTTFQPGKVVLTEGSSSTSLPPPPSSVDDNVLVWSGQFKHGYYGSDLPAVRACGIVNMSPQSLMELLVDSSRVKEYNKLSLGRTDLVTFDGNLQTPGPFGNSVTKVMKSVTKPPLIRKTLVFVSLLHAKELVDGSGYLIVTRAVHHHKEEEEEDTAIGNVVKSEILMGVNLIRKIEGQPSRCLMINVNHIRSPMVPLMVAKRIGISSAVNFINDVRSLC